MNRKIVTELCARLNITIDDNSTSRYFDINFDAPRGYTFDAIGCHSIVCHQNKGFGPEAVADFWREAKSDIDYGLSRCTESDCDVCSEV